MQNTHFYKQKRALFKNPFKLDRVSFSTPDRKSRSEVPDGGDFGEENCLGKGGADRGEKGKKDAQNYVYWFFSFPSHSLLDSF